MNINFPTILYFIGSIGGMYVYRHYDAALGIFLMLMGVHFLNLGLRR